MGSETGDTRPQERPVGSASGEKPLDIWLAIAGLVAAVVLFLIPKTPTAVCICTAALFLLTVHPVWNFWWIEKSLARRVFALVSMAIVCLAVGVVSWPREAHTDAAPATLTYYANGSRFVTVGNVGPGNALNLQLFCFSNHARYNRYWLPHTLVESQSAAQYEVTTFSPAMTATIKPEQCEDVYARDSTRLDDLYLIVVYHTSDGKQRIEDHEFYYDASGWNEVRVSLSAKTVVYSQVYQELHSDGQ